MKKRVANAGYAPFYGCALRTSDPFRVKMIAATYSDISDLMSGNVCRLKLAEDLQVVQAACFKRGQGVTISNAYFTELVPNIHAFNDGEYFFTVGSSLVDAEHGLRARVVECRGLIAKIHWKNLRGKYIEPQLVPSKCLTLITT